MLKNYIIYKSYNYNIIIFFFNINIIKYINAKI